MAAAVVCLLFRSEFFTANLFNTNFIDTLQYLDIPEFTKHARLLADRSSHFATDPEYLSMFHEESLKKAKGDGKKEARSDLAAVF